MSIATLRGAGLVLRQLRRSDDAEWTELRRANRHWLDPWEASNPDGEQLPTFRQFIRFQNRASRLGTAFGWAITEGGPILGHVTLSQVSWGAMRTGMVGYWVSQDRAGEGLTPRAVALVTDTAFAQMNLHRIEINIRPENGASLRVVSKLGFRDEGIRRRFIYIDGDWRDHRTFALVAEETGSLVERLWPAPPQA